MAPEMKNRLTGDTIKPRACDLMAWACHLFGSALLPFPPFNEWRRNTEGTTKLRLVHEAVHRQHGVNHLHRRLVKLDRG